MPAIKDRCPSCGAAWQRMDNDLYPLAMVHEPGCSSADCCGDEDLGAGTRFFVADGPIVYGGEDF